MKRICSPNPFALLFCVLACLSAAFWLNMTPLLAQEDSIVLTGRVTSQIDDSPLEGVTIRLFDAGFPGQFDVATTDAAGFYTVTSAITFESANLIPGTFYVYFDSNGTFISEYYSDTYVYSEAIPLHLTAMTPTLGIDAALVEGGELRGKITAQEDSQPLSPTYVSILSLVGDEIAGSYNVDPSGVYTTTGVPPGTYKLRVTGPDAYHVATYYPNATTFADAEPVEINAGAVLTDINFVLPLGGIISGTLTTNARGAILLPNIEVYDANGELFTNWRRDPLLTLPEYALWNLPTGEYRVRFSDENAFHHPEFYDNQTTITTATSISVTAGNITSASVVLDYIPRLDSIATSAALSQSILLTLDFNPVVIYTANGGEFWRAVGTTPWVSSNRIYLFGLGLAPRTEGGISRRLIVAPTSDGLARELSLYRSGDNGQSWAENFFTNENPNLAECSNQSFSTVIASPFNPSKLYILYTCTIYHFGGSSNITTMYISQDAGLTWQKVDSPSLDTGTKLLASPTVNNRLYVRQYITWQQSDDDGATWQDFDIRLQELTLDAQDANWLYGITPMVEDDDHSIGKRSEDGGETWQDWPQQPCSLDTNIDTIYRDKRNIQVMAHPTQTKMIFVRCNAGLYRSTNGGDSWQQLATFPGQLLAPDYGNPGRIFWGREDGLWASRDNGDSWQVLMPDYRLSSPTLLEPHYLPNIAGN